MKKNLLSKGLLNLVCALIVASLGSIVLGVFTNMAAAAPVQAPLNLFTGCANVVEIPLEECNALVDLYNNLNGPNWINPINDWLETDTPCSWYGITCNGGFVTEVQLMDNDNGIGVTGDMPLSVLDLDHLSLFRFDCGVTSSNHDVIEFLNQTSPSWRCSQSRFAVRIAQNSVLGYDWDPGASITFSVDDPGNGVGWDYTYSTYAYGNGNVYLSPANNFLNDVTLAPGMFLKMTDGTITKYHTITDFVVTNINTTTDIIEGTGIEGTQVGNQYCAAGTCYRRWSTVQSGGAWQADFSVAGTEPDEQVLDITEGMNGVASQYDSDNDATVYRWYEREINVPMIIAHSNGNELVLFNWSGSTVNISVTDDPQQNNGFDFSAENLYVDDSAYYISLGNFSQNPASVVTVTDGPITKTLTITDIHITEIDTAFDTASGNSNLVSSSLDVLGKCGSASVATTVATDVNGGWDVDFASTTPTLDLEIGCEITAYISDQDGDRTEAWWKIKAPIFEVFETQNRVRALYWTLGSNLTVSVDDPNTIDDPDYSGTYGPVVVRGMGNPTTWIESINLDTIIDIQPGMTVTVSDGVTEKEMVIPESIAVTNINHVADTVTGTADPDTELRVFVLGGFGLDRYVIADSSTGEWIADFSSGGPVYDITPNEDGVASITDNDGDAVWQHWVDIDGDGTPDLTDPCPNDATDSCDQTASVAHFIGSNGGELTPTNGSITMVVPGGALPDDDNKAGIFSLTSFTTSNTYNTDQGDMSSLLASHIEPSGTAFGSDTPITFTWDDVDDNGIVDGTSKNEAELYISKDGIVIAGPCGSDAGCDMVSNTYTVQVTSLSFFVVGTVKKEYVTTRISQASYDGFVLESSETSGKGGTKINTGNTFIVGDDASDRQYRGILSFNTSGIPANAFITKVTLKVKKAGLVGTNPFNSHQGLRVDIRSGRFGTSPNLQVSDFQATANKNLAGQFSSKLVSGWYTANIGNSYFPLINRTGETQFRLRFYKDDNNDFDADYFNFYSGNAPAASRPQLIVEYYVP